ncbi:ATP-cone domain-containing protein [Sporocytophaga myxococcoides]|uniref:ATP-cone domain-containing protein n=1 Tax=Sporocytophaga myxococcoides TaxID=153721 RepID=A0A098L9K2_9BACT|nr:restriction endonuclease [Sporocytophaga myxococcoides]GAL83636.1 ATP-cone domain-containing protein [Sporocytophaga myxococcoides]
MRDKKIYIEKASGDKVIFSEEKLRRSLSKACRDRKTVDEIIKSIVNGLVPGMTTQQIYTKAFDLLASISKPSAGKYKLKAAIMELGPSGYPFERYFGEILKHQGFEVQIGQIVQGHCVNHEIDIIAIKGDKHFMVECKFHNRPGFQCDVKIPLYIQARFEDVIKQMKTLPGHSEMFHQGWVVTNTRFTGDAIQYGKCIGLNLIGWDYPDQGSLNDLIDASNLYPLTCLTTLTNIEKEKLLENKIVLSKDLCNDEKILEIIGVHPRRISEIMKETLALCHDSNHQNNFK